MLIQRPEEVLYHNARARWYNADTQETRRDLIRATHRLARPYQCSLSKQDCQELSEYYQNRHIKTS